MNSGHEKIIGFRDVAIGASLLAAGALSVLVPVRYWSSVSQLIAKFAHGVAGSALSATRKLGEVAVAHPAYQHVDEMGVRFVQTYVESRLQVTDQSLLRKWKPEIDVVGQEHIDTALANGHGVILWITPFAFSDMLAKMAIGRAGYEVSHLSRPGHGFSASRFGVNVLNPLRTRVEDRYLKDRIRIREGEERPAVVAMRRALKNNGIVSITVGSQSKSTEWLPMHGGHLCIATGPVRLAQLSGAPLLPVFAVRESGQRFRLEVRESVIVSGDDMRGTLERYVAVLESYVSEFPDQWRGMGDFRA